MYVMHEPLIATTTVNPVEAVNAIQDLVKPVVQHATDWALKVGLAITSGSALYALAIKAAKND